MVKATRRQALSGAMAAAALAATPLPAASTEKPMKAVDFRTRPPFKSIRTALHPKADPRKSDATLMAEFFAEMDAAGIGFGLIMGRQAPGPGVMTAAIRNEDVAELIGLYSKRFLGLGAVDVRDPKAAVAEIDRCKAMGLRGIAFDNPLSDPPLYDDDASLMALYERCAQHGMMVSLTSSIMVGPDMSYSMPIHIQHVALRFPKMPVIVPHAAWPWTTQMIGTVLQGVMFGLSSIYIMPDFYLSQAHAPGRQDYIDAANFGLAGRILYASSYPALAMRESLVTMKATPFADPATLPRILRTNAMELLGMKELPV